MNSHLLLITASPNSDEFMQALNCAKNLLCSNAKDFSTHNKIHVFFYSDSAYIANAFIWQAEGQINTQQEWQSLAQKHQLDLNVCVSTALNRGITDAQNSKRHNIFVKNHTEETPQLADNLASGFQLVGLGVLADLMHTCAHLHIY